MRPQLTIAIPTYNRGNKLKLALENLLQCTKGKNVEILVSDNASTDNSEEVVRQVQRSHHEVQYFRNNSNLGFDGNFLNCFCRATGEYVWLLSDDDILLPGAIESVFEGCQKNPVCMHLNSASLVREHPLEYGKPRFPENGFLAFSDKNDFLESIGIYCTFVSSLVFKTDYVRAIPNKERYFHTNILQSHILLEIMKNDGLYMINTKTCVAARANTVVHYDLFKTWICNYSELLLTTAPACGFEKMRMKRLLYRALSTTILNDYIPAYRLSCPDEANWERVEIWKYINLFPDIAEKYKIVIDCPVKRLKWIKLLTKAERVWRRITKYAKRKTKLQK